MTESIWLAFRTKRKFPRQELSATLERSTEIGLMRDNFALKLAAMLFLLTALPASNRAALGDVLEIKGDGSTFASPMYAKSTQPC